MICRIVPSTLHVILGVFHSNPFNILQIITGVHYHKYLVLELGLKTTPARLEIFLSPQHYQVEMICCLAII